MSWSCGIVGLPNAGKSSLFKALTALDVTIENYPFSTIDPNKAIVPIPDDRLLELSSICQSVKTTHATIEVIDVAGLVAGASRGEGLGNQFLGQLRSADLLIHVVSNYDSADGGREEAMSQMAVVNLELSLADIDTVSKRMQKLEPRLKSGDKKSAIEASFLSRLKESLSKGIAVRALGLSFEEEEIVAELFLLTAKEMIYVFNAAEDLISDLPVEGVIEGCPLLYLSARLEAEIVELENDEKQDYMNAFNLQESRVARLLAACYKHLNLLTFYTVKGEEARAWVIPSGTSAVNAAGKVHTDMQVGFINAEVISFDQLSEAGNFARAREKGLLRTEGRNYNVCDGDILLFRFRQ